MEETCFPLRTMFHLRHRMEDMDGFVQPASPSSMHDSSILFLTD
jgi:hypothetical protein